MKIAIALFALLLSITAQANTILIKKPVLYFYQDNTTLNQRIGSDEDINKKAQQVYDAFKKNSEKIKAGANEKPFYLVVVFNDKNTMRYWIETENNERKKTWEKIAKKSIKNIPFKTTSGSAAIAFYFGIEGNNDPLSAKPPILSAWDETIEKSKKITANDLFDQLLAEKK